ncbi:MAG: DUF58 domain-containing protein [Fusobacteriaceae bacterium]
MEKKEILKKIKEIEINSNILAKEIFSGSYHSCFHGNGMEFGEIRRYSPGDDVKKIDWKVTAKQRKAYVKEFVEERELAIYLVIDVSASTRNPKQKQQIAELLTTLAFSANSNNDRVGAILFSDEIEKFIPVKKGKKHSLSILDSFLSSDFKSKKTNINNVLNYFNKIVKRSSVIFFISDFLDENYERLLKITSQKHDFIPIRVLEKGKDKIPKGAIFTFIDSETNESLTFENFKATIKLNSDFNLKKSITINSDEDYRKALIKFFKERG